jgi:hypothetical protein
MSPWARLLVAFLACAVVMVGAPSTSSAGTLANLTLMHTNNLAHQTQYHTLSFSTATAGVIQTIEIDYQASGSSLPSIGKARLIEVAGIGNGTFTTAAFGEHGIYTVTAPVNVPAQTPVKIMLGDISARDHGCYGLVVTTKDAGGNPIDAAGFPINAFCTTQMQSDNMATDSVTADALAGVTQLAFGTCPIDPPSIADNQEYVVHVACALGPATGPDRVIAMPPADFARGLVPTGASIHCLTAADCHLDVKMLNEKSLGSTIDGPPQIWTYIAFRQ